jgi:peptide/nickel transport system substrate-binding protein
VPDAATRVAQIETGELDFADDLDLNAYDRLRKTAGVQPIVAKPYYWLVGVFNKKEGLMTNQKLRQAWQAALDIEPIMKNVAGGHAELYRMDSSLAFAENAPWHTKIQGLPWNERNREKVKRLLREAGYKGEPIRFMTTQEYKWMYDFALLSKQQLEDAGFTIDLQVVDWATLVQRRNKPEGYEVFSTGFTFNPEPAFNTATSCNWPGWWCHEDKEQWVEALARESDPRKRKAMLEKVQAIMYEDVGRIKFGDYFTLDVTRKEVGGYRATNELNLWNVWLK